MKRVLVIGGAGYLGSVLCRKLLSKGYIVRVLDCLLYGDSGIRDYYDNPNFEFIYGDIRNIQDIIRSIEDSDIVIHLAAIVGDPASDLKPEESLEINQLATENIIKICKKNSIDRFIFASTCSVYGASDNKLLDEESQLNPVSLYAEMKVNSENIVLNNCSDNFCATIFRMATLYGISPRMRFDLVANLFVIKAIKEGKISLFGGEQKRCFCNIEDVADAYIWCLDLPKTVINKQIYNISSDNLKIKELVDVIQNYIQDVDIEIYDKNWDERSYITSSDKFRKLGWESKITIDSFIDKMKYNINNGKWSDYKDSIYNNYKHLKMVGVRKDCE